jgi:hypothetical protein
MKYFIKIISIAIIALLMAFIACSDPIGNETGNASFSITINGSSRAAALSWEPEILVSSLVHTITLTNDSGESLPPREGLKSGDTANFSVAPGYWTVTVKAYLLVDGVKILKAEGVESRYLKPGRNPAVTVNMHKPGEAQNGKHHITMRFDPEHGSAAATPDAAEEGEEVTITATENMGYGFVEWKVISGGITLGKANPSKFTMPDNDVIIEAIFVFIPPNTPFIVFELPMPELEEVEYGYKEQPKHDVTIKNIGTGTGTAHVTSIELDERGNAAFTLSGNLTPTISAEGGTATFTVQPKHKLSAQTYEGTIIVTYDSGATAEAVISFTVNKAEGWPVDAPLSTSEVSANRITINPVTHPNSGQEVEYAISTTNTAPDEGWQTSTTFDGLSAGTIYYIFARSAENQNYKAGTPIDSLEVIYLGTGVQDDPFIVHDPETLGRVGKGTSANWTGDWTLSAYYKQIRDINLSLVPNWSPIGTSSSNALTGSYDGGGHTISNLTISGGNNLGLFGFIMGNNAIVKNVGLVECNISGGSGIGGIVANNGQVGLGNSGGIVENCYVSGSVSGTGGNVGGVVSINMTGGIVRNCYATGSVSGGGSNVGGVIGRTLSTVQNCYATCDVLGTDRVGGVVGEIEGTVQNCVALNPNISGTTNIGRVISYSSDTRINNYGRSDMACNGLPAPSAWTTGNATTQHGANITAADWNSENWWKNTDNWDTVWDFNDVWEWSGSSRLPILKNMPTGTQNPTVQPIPPINAASDAELKAAYNAISNAGNGTAGNLKNYTINITGDFSMSGYTTNTFSTVAYINVTITGDKTITLTGQGSLLYLGDNQTVVIRNTGFKGNNGNNIELVIIKSSSASLTMEGNSSISNNTGSGVSNDGNFTMKDNASVHHNTTKATGEYGGGVRNGKNFTMEGNASVHNNNASRGGGGVNPSQGIFTMKDNASIHDNTVTGDATDFTGGGGIYMGSGIFNMTGGTISDNTVTTGHGGGVYIYAGTFNMIGGTISGNTASKNGGGLYTYFNPTIRIETGTIYGTDNPNLQNTSSSGAAFYKNAGTAERGYFSTPGDPTSAWTSKGTLTNSETTLNVVNGNVVP